MLRNVILLEVPFTGDKFSNEKVLMQATYTIVVGGHNELCFVSMAMFNQDKNWNICFEWAHQLSLSVLYKAWLKCYHT